MGKRITPAFVNKQIRYFEDHNGVIFDAAEAGDEIAKAICGMVATVDPDTLSDPPHIGMLASMIDDFRKSQRKARGRDG